MTFEDWWKIQTANFDPEEIGLMQLARVTWNAAQEIERESCASLADKWGDARNIEYGGAACKNLATAMRQRPNAQVQAAGGGVMPPVAPGTES